MSVVLRHLPIDRRFAHAETVALRSKSYTALRVWLLLEAALKMNCLDRHALPKESLPDREIGDAFEITNHRREVVQRAPAGTFAARDAFQGFEPARGRGKLVGPEHKEIRQMPGAHGVRRQTE